MTPVTVRPKIFIHHPHIWYNIMVSVKTNEVTGVGGLFYFWLNRFKIFFESTLQDIDFYNHTQNIFVEE